MKRTAEKVTRNMTASSYTGGGIVVAACGGQETFQVKSTQNRSKHDEIEG